VLPRVCLGYDVIELLENSFTSLIIEFLVKTSPGKTIKKEDKHRF